MNIFNMPDAFLFSFQVRAYLFLIPHSEVVTIIPIFRMGKVRQREVVRSLLTVRQLIRGRAGYKLRCQVNLTTLILFTYVIGLTKF